MLFAVSWAFGPQHRDAANKRFKETGAPPPEGVKMIGRWHSVGGGEGFLVCESDDPTALGAWMQQWSDLITFRVFPVVDDEGVVKILSAAG